MDARLLRASILLAVTWILGTNYSLGANYAASPRGLAATEEVVSPSTSSCRPPRLRLQAGV